MTITTILCYVVTSFFPDVAHAEMEISGGMGLIGMGMCIYAQHEFVQVNEVSNIQQGERYVLGL